jgi:hypothetical protein
VSHWWRQLKRKVPEQHLPFRYVKERDSLVAYLFKVE